MAKTTKTRWGRRRPFNPTDSSLGNEAFPREVFARKSLLIAFVASVAARFPRFASKFFALLANPESKTDDARTTALRRLRRPRKLASFPSGRHAVFRLI